MIDKLGGLKLPPFKYSVSRPSLCAGHLYRVDSRSDEQRAEFFAVTALAAVTDLPAIGWDDAPGRVAIIGDVDRINDSIQPKIRLLAQTWGVALPDAGRMIFVGRSESVRGLFGAPRHLAGRVQRHWGYRPQQGAVLGHHRADGHAGRAGWHHPPRAPW